MPAASARVRSSAVGQRWVYVCSVVVAFACPRARLTVATSQPARDESGRVEVPQVVEALNPAVRAGLGERAYPLFGCH